MFQMRVLRLTMLISLSSTVAILDSGSLNAQSPLSLQNVGAGLPTGGQAIGASNPWFGAQVGYRFGESSEFASNLLVSGQVVYPIDMGGSSKFSLPIIGNIAPLAQAIGAESSEGAIEDQAKELLTSATGVMLGLYPYYKLHDSDHLLVTMNALASWRLNALRPFGEDTSSTDYVYLHQGKFGAGIELVVGARADGASPLTLNLSPVITVFGESSYERAFGKARSSLLALEATAILPLKKGIGVVFEGIFAEEDLNAFRVGIVLAAEP